MHDTLDLGIRVPGGLLGEQEEGGVGGGEVLFEGQHLPAVAQRVAREQAQLGEGIDDDAQRLDPLRFVEDPLEDLVQLDFGGVEEGVLRPGPGGLRRGGQVEDVDAVQGPAVRVGHLADLVLGLGKGDVEARLSAPHALQEVLERDGGLAGAGPPLQEVGAKGGKAAA